MGEAIAFYSLSALILVFAVLVISTRNPVHSALFLVGNFLCVAMLYVVLHAEFLAVIQVLVYAGGIMVLYLFVVMLVNLKRAPEAVEDPRRRERLGLLVSGAVLAQLVAISLYSFAAAPPAPAPGAPTPATGLGNVEAVGWLLYVDYVIPFEVASVLLLVAMVGAIVLAKREL
jgi:NADH-quinone oxidoreductase subunit J